MPANPSLAPEVLAKLAEIEAQVREIHYYGCPPDARLQGRVDRDVESIMEPLRAALTALAAAQREAETLREALLACADYVRHQPGCTFDRLPGDAGDSCSCGLKALRAKANAALAPRSPEGEERT